MNPFFVVGVSRSGTTYLHHLLNTHPGIRLSYEGHLFNEGWQCYNRYQDLTNRQQFEDLINELVACDHNEKLNNWIGDSIHGSVDSLFNAYLENPSFTGLIEQIYHLPGSVKAWGNKMLRLEMAEEILQHWPGARFVILIRDPRAVFASQKRFFPERRIKYSAIYWNIHAAAVKAGLVPQEQCLLFKYEDFVQSPQEHLEKTLDFLELPDDGSARKMLEEQPASARSLNKWRASLSDAEVKIIESICFDEMKYYGYEPEVATTGVKLGILTKATETFLDKKSSLSWNPAVWKRKNILKRFWYTITR